MVAQVTDQSTDPSDLYPGLNQPVTVKCKNDFCENLVQTTNGCAARLCGVYCPGCRAEAKRITDRNSYQRHKVRINRGRRENYAANAKYRKE